MGDWLQRYKVIVRHEGMRPYLVVTNPNMAFRDDETQAYSKK